MPRSLRSGLVLACLVTLLLPAVSEAGRRRRPGGGGPPPVTSVRITKAETPTHLYVIHETGLSSAEKTMLATLQGIVSRSSSSQIYLHPQVGGYETWLQDLQANHGVATTVETDPWALVTTFQGYLSGYLLFQAGNDSINVATSLAGVEDAIAVEASIEGQAVAAGLTRVDDVRTRDEVWLKATHGSRFNPTVAFEQTEALDHQLRGYATLSKGLTFYDGNSSFRDTVVDDLDPDGATFGWGDATIGEDVFVGASSDRGVFTIAADHTHNLAPLSGIPVTQQQQTARFTPAVESGVHYASFVMTDGDNVQWLLGNFQSDPAWFGSSLRGDFDMGYGIPPVLARLAPSVMSWYYANAASGPGHDSFVVGPSGGGYLYPSRYPAADLATHVGRLAAWMGLGDLRVVQILDSQAHENTAVWDVYTARPEIHGLVYLEYADYSASAGRVVWSNGKPVASPRTKIWNGLPNSDTTSVTNAINSAPRDPTSPEGYSLVSLAAWGHSLNDVETVVNGLAPDVRVVTPEALIELMAANVPHAVDVRHDYTGADFQTSDMTLVGSALWITDNDPLFAPRPNRLRLTSNNGGQFGSAWHTTLVDPAQSWTSSYRFQLSYPVNGGADGIGFHLQGNGAAANPTHEGGGLTFPHLSVAIDTWDNGPEGTAESLKVVLNGSQVYFNDLLDFGPDPNPGSSPTVFRMELVYVSASQELFIRLFDEGGSDALYDSVSVDLSTLGPSHAGFSGLTGGSAENHDVRTWNLTAAVAGP